MIAILIEDKKFTKDSTPEKEFSAFARYMETQIASAKPEYEAKKKRAEEKANKAKREEEEEKKKAGEESSYRGFHTQEKSDTEKTFKYVKQAVDANPGNRRLVHLVDVQKSIQRDLAEVQSSHQHNDGDLKDGLEPEEDKDVKLRNASLLFQYGLDGIV
ncbi:hypothetical protein E1B28_011547 [Marasmius oreades]|uniref:Uncharacterized protein n=1 Tax=Marasmius oreades TaxID=181124 RepID=A0A9P7US77_9AGAR|nr:uncharacterized protein E1B28_011547 [Marasmius oreades]KAG7089914.1 hypothetical protein E1B28_011547 [Marasmius oreades]